jgi:phage terminase large subunit
MADVNSQVQFDIEMINHYYNNPYDFVVDQIKVTPTAQQEKVLKSLPKCRRIAVRSGNGIGKTALESWIILWFMYTHPDCRVICTATTQSQIQDVLWSEVKKWLDKSNIKHLFTWTATSLYCNKYPNTWFAVAKTSNEPTHFQGFHEQNIMFIVDEASGVMDEIWEAVRGSLTTENAYCLLFGNPNYLEGFFYHAFHSKSDLWTTFQFSALESPQVTKASLDELERDCGGTDTNQWRIRALGEFPADDASDLYIPLSLLEPCLVDKQVVWENDPHADFEYDLGVDIARFGDDDTVMTVSKHNMRYTPNKVIDIVNIQTLRHQPLTAVAGYVISMHKHWNFKSIYVDETGLGSGVYDILHEQGLPVIPVTFNKKVETGKIADTNKEAMYKHLKLLLEKQVRVVNNRKLNKTEEEYDIIRIPKHPHLVTQCVTLHYDYSSSGVLMIHHDDGGHDDYPDSLALSLFRGVKKRVKSSYSIA